MEDKKQTAPESHGEMSKNSSNTLQDVTNFIDRNLSYIRYTSYGLGAIGVILIGRSVYITQKFRSFKDIPSRYISEHVKLRGRVKSVSSEGVIGVDHIPIITSRRLKSHRVQASDHLRVVLGGVEILESSIPWLQNTLLDRVVWFRMLSSCPQTESLACIVTVKKNAFRNMCINEAVIREGLATVDHMTLSGLEVDTLYNKLSQRLTKAETYAEKKGKGIWTRPTLKEKLKELPRTVASNTSSYLRLRLDTVLSKLKWWNKK